MKILPRSDPLDPELGPLMGESYHHLAHLAPSEAGGKGEQPTVLSVIIAYLVLLWASEVK